MEKPRLMNNSGLKYHLRLLFFALISEIPFDLALSGDIFYPFLQNVGFTLFIGLAMLTLLSKIAFNSNGRLISSKAIIMIFSAMVLAIPSDGGPGGILMIATLYLCDKRNLLWWVGISSSVALLFLQSGAGWGGLWSVWLVIPFLFLINPRYSQRHERHKWHYFIYPLHFLILYLLHRLLIS